MSMNIYMHPRNIYKQPPNFKQLALQYPEFRKYITQDVSGKVTLDFKNVEALRALTCTLLKKDFNLDLEIPTNKLIPTVPLRLNYLLWIEDLLNLFKCTENVKGIDIGTGASCIYPLISARKSNWSMVATDIDPESIKSASSNVTRNNLNDLINILHVDGHSLLLEVFDKLPSQYDFVMCNPPFFASTQELHPFFKARKSTRPHPKNAFCATRDEVVATGGEVQYISKLINESKTLETRIKVYTTMVGHKTNLPRLKKQLREVGVVSFKQTEFCQGHTTRWGLAWTFHDVDLTKIPDSLIAAKQKLPRPLFHQLGRTGDETCKVSSIAQRLVGIFKELGIEYHETKHVKHLVEYVVVAYADTWSHQRRKRREKLKQGDSEGEVHETCEQLADLDFKSSKRTLQNHDQEDGFYRVKRTKTESESEERIYLKGKVSVIEADGIIGLELTFFEGTGTKEALHQVLQFIKNNIVKKQV